MTEFKATSGSVDVEQIMRQIRGRIREKRGVDYTEEQIHELANARLERFLDPSGVRSGLLEEFRRRPAPPAYAFEDTTLFESDKAIVRFFRRLLRPFLKLLFNPNQLTTVLHTQAAINQQQEERHVLYFEVIHNLVVEMTRVSIEAKNLKMRVESLQGRLEFNERRARALEAVVQYKRDALHAGREEDGSATEPQGGVDPITGGESLRTKRRRRRRGRRVQGQPGSGETAAGEARGDDRESDAEPESAESSSHVDVRSGHLTIRGRTDGANSVSQASGESRDPARDALAEGGSHEGATPAEAGSDESRARTQSYEGANPAEAGSHENRGRTQSHGGASPAEAGSHENRGRTQSHEGANPADGGSHEGTGTPDTPRDSEPQ